MFGCMVSENSTNQDSSESVTSPKSVYITETPPPVTKGNIAFHGVFHLF